MMLYQLLIEPWHWAFSGFAAALVMLSLIYFGKFFGLSSTYTTWCAAMGAGKRVPLFDFDWKRQRWNLTFAGGVIAGGWVAHQFLQGDHIVGLACATNIYLQDLAIIPEQPPMAGYAFVPELFFNLNSPHWLPALFVQITGGVLSGFGARYAGGCTSGHLMSGLCNLQQGSLIAAISFMVGGLLFTNVLLPMIATLF